MNKEVGFRSASVAGLGTLSGGFKGRIVAQSLMKIDASKNEYPPKNTPLQQY